MKKISKRKIESVLRDAGESEFNLSRGQTLRDALDTGARMLDKACLTNALVLRDYKGRHYVGEFSFVLHPVSKKEALRVAENFANEQE